VNLGPAEILVILVVALLVFGPNRLPEIGRQVGKGVREFRKFQRSLSSDLNDVLADDVSDHAEPAPQLPPRDGQTTPAVDAGAGTDERSEREPDGPSAPPAGTAT
jgi:sec-independent protein translocase protein TatA